MLLTPPTTPERFEKKPRSALDWYWIKWIIGYVALTVSVWAFATFKYSRGSHPNFYRYSYKLQDGLFGKIDNSDAQYSNFRNNIPILVGVSGVYLVLGRLATFIGTKKIYTLLFSLIFLTVLYGSSILKILILIGFNYLLSKLRIPILTWIFSISILFLNEFYQGYKFGDVGLDWLDGYKGMMRWEITFNFTILRMISYSMDYHWQKDPRDTPSKLSSHDFNLFNYLTYITYAPLYMAGPIITFTDFISQLNQPKRSTTGSTLKYAFRWIGAVILMETMMPLFHVVAIKDTKAYQNFSALEIFSLGYFNLKHIWLKLLIIWRFFRLWAMADGIETQENMVNCMSNNYSGIKFWRGWHASYNKWLIRYLYIPLGGNKNRLLNSLVIFTFVGLWHDIQLNLLAWGWLIVLFLIPEIICTSYFTRPAIRKSLGNYHLHLCAFGAMLNIFMMITANLVGFAVGVDGMLELASQLLQPSGFLFLLFVGSTYFGFAHIGFYVEQKTYGEFNFFKCADNKKGWFSRFQGKVRMNKQVV